MTTETISPAERIRELSSINAKIATLVSEAGNAITALTDRPLATPQDQLADANPLAPTLQERKDAFTGHTKAYYTSLQAIVARLRRQAYALEEAGIIASEAPASSTWMPARTTTVAPGAAAQSAATQEGDHITNGGLGNLDVGWLNSRGNQVEADKEAELIEHAKIVLEDLLKK